MFALMNHGSFFTELKRRNVYKVAIAYGVVGWLLIQIATATFPVLEIPNWATKLVIAIVVLGFPLALIFAWASSSRRKESSARRIQRRCLYFLLPPSSRLPVPP